MNVKRRIINLLYRGKDRFRSAKDLVKDWDHITESTDGYTTIYTHQVRPNDKTICRMCIVGGVAIEIDTIPTCVLEQAVEVLNEANISLFPNKSLQMKHSLKEVHRIYDKAIELVKDNHITLEEY
jgi:hypothetical protein